jgi:hypothetical protein
VGKNFNVEGKWHVKFSLTSSVHFMTVSHLLNL